MDQWGDNKEEEVVVPAPSTSVLYHESVPGLLAVLVALGTLLAALYPTWGDGWMPVRGDAMTYFWPLREALSTALRAGTLPLYETLNNGGTALWINPQTQSFYPPARLFGYAPVPHAIGILHSAHLVLLFGGVVALLRRLDFRYSSASLAALSVALGGTFLSVSPMYDKAHSAAWIPLMLWAGLSLHRPILLPRFVLAASTAMAVLAGGLDMVVLGVLTTVLAASVAGVTEPEFIEPLEEDDDEEEDEEDLFGGDAPIETEDDFRPLLGGEEEAEEQANDEAPIQSPSPFAALWGGIPERAAEASRVSLHACLWITIGLGLSAHQWLPFRAFIETSSWSQPLEAAELGARALRFGDILGLIAPNLPYDAVSSTYRPPGADEPTGVYLPGLYAGGSGLLLGAVGAVHLVRMHFAQERQRWLIAGPALAATIGSLLCVLMATGPAIPLIGWLETNLPIISSIRYPEKWLLPAAILAAVPIAHGARLLASTQLLNRTLLRVGAALLAVILLLTIGAMTVEGDASRGMSLSAGALAVGVLICALWRLQVGPDRQLVGALGIALAILIAGVELSSYNLPLSPLEDPAEIVTPPPAAARILLSADKQRRASGTLLPGRARLHQASYSQHDKDPVTPPDAPLHLVLREALLGGVAAVWGIEIMRDWLVMPPEGLERWYDAILEMPLARQFRGLRLAGITHLVVHFRDDALELLPLVRDGLLEEVFTPEGAWTQVVLFALTDPLPACRWTPLGMPASDGLPVVPTRDSGGVWEGRVSAGNGLLVCIRPWDPSWHAEIDGNEVDTQIVNGFQLAIPVPAGVHEVRMEYRPRGMKMAKNLQILSAALCFILLGFGLMRTHPEGETNESPAPESGQSPEQPLGEHDHTAEHSAEGDEAYGYPPEGAPDDGSYNA